MDTEKRSGQRRTMKFIFKGPANYVIEAEDFKTLRKKFIELVQNNDLALWTLIDKIEIDKHTSIRIKTEKK